MFTTSLCTSKIERRIADLVPLNNKKGDDNVDNTANLSTKTTNAAAATSSNVDELATKRNKYVTRGGGLVKTIVRFA